MSFPSLTACALLIKRSAFFLVATACLLFMAPLRAADNGSGGIEGTVYNSSNGQPVAKAKVTIVGTVRETLTGDDGRFVFADVPPGGVSLEISYLGFEPQTAVVTVTAGQTASSEFQLAREGTATRSPTVTDDGVIELAEFTVVADSAMNAQAVAMNEQRRAASISNVLALDELPGQGFENIGDYVRFLPGVSILDNGESAGQLSLSGFPANMTNIQLDGGTIASTGIDDVSRAGGRELSLQDVPMMNIERVEVTKVPTPDKPASGLGGSMNLVSKGLLGTRKPRLDYTLSLNLATNDNLSFSGESPQAAIPQLSTAHKQPSYSLSAVVPVSKRLVFSAAVSKSWKQRPADTITETAEWNLWDGVRFNSTTSTTVDGISYPGTPIFGDYPAALNSATWSEIAEITSTEDFQTGVEWGVSKRDTLTFNIRHREVSAEHTTNRLQFVYGSANNVTPRYNATVPPGGDPATSTSNNDRRTGNLTMGTNGPSNYNLETATDQLSLRYKHRGSEWNLDGMASYSHAERLRSNRGRGYVSGFSAGSSADAATRLFMTGTGINTTDSILPTESIATRADGTSFNPFDADNYRLGLIRAEEHGVYLTDNYEGRLDAERVFNRFFSLKTGGAFSREERDNQRELPTYRMNSSNPDGFTGDPQSVGNYDLIDESIQTSIGGVPVRWISPVKVYNLLRDRPELFNLDSDPYEQRAQNSKKMIEDIAAGYLRADLRLFHNRLHAVLGARYERTTVDGWSGRTDAGAIYQRDENGNRIPDTVNGGYLTHPEDEWGWRINQERAAHLSKSYDGIYPSVNLNYSITENLVARAAYARTIGRPNVSDIVSGVTIPEVQDEPGSYRVNVSNPGLEPWTADSFHLSFDSYHFKGGFGSIGVYRKNVTNFFESVARPATVEDLLALGIPESDIAAMTENGSSVTLSRRENIGDAELTGLEFSYRQDLFFLPSWLQKTQVWANYTHLNIGGPNAEDFTGFTPEAISAGINYIRSRFSLRISAAHQAETKLRRPARPTSGAVTAHLIPPDTFEYQAALTRWSATVEYSVSRAFSVYANCSDIFGDDVITYRRGPDTPDYAAKYQRRVVASYVTLGVKGTF